MGFVDLAARYGSHIPRGQSFILDLKTRCSRRLQAEASEAGRGFNALWFFPVELSELTKIYHLLFTHYLHSAKAR